MHCHILVRQRIIDAEKLLATRKEHGIRSIAYRVVSISSNTLKQKRIPGPQVRNKTQLGAQNEHRQDKKRKDPVVNDMEKGKEKTEMKLLLRQRPVCFEIHPAALPPNPLEDAETAEHRVTHPAVGVVGGVRPLWRAVGARHVTTSVGTLASHRTGVVARRRECRPTAAR